MSGKLLDQQPPPAWPRLIDLPVWVERATQRLLRHDGCDSVDLQPIVDAVWDILDTIPTFLRLVFSKDWDSDRLQSFEYLRIDRRVGTAKIEVRGRIADGDGRDDKRGWQVIARLLGIPANNWVRDAYDLEKRFSRGRLFALEFDRRAMEGVVVWLLTGRLSGAALAPLRVTQEVVVKAVSPEVLDELRRLFSSVPPSERTAQTPSASASKTPGSATPTENASDDDVDACLRHFAALSPDGKISRTQLRTLPAVEWVITVRNRNTNKDALETRLPDSVHDGIRRGRGKRANRD